MNSSNEPNKPGEPAKDGKTRLREYLKDMDLEELVARLFRQPPRQVDDSEPAEVADEHGQVSP